MDSVTAASPTIDNSAFDQVIERRGTNAIKWGMYPADVLPLWVADMDFPAPPAVLEALRARLDHPLIGYQIGSPELTAVLIERLKTRHHIETAAEGIVYVPGIVFGLNALTRIIGEPGDGVIIMPPVYPPFAHSIEGAARVVQNAPLIITRDGGRLTAAIDFDALEAAVTERSRALMLSNPHNPTGNVFTRAELERLAEFALRHDLIVIADEIHCDLVFDDAPPFVSIASLSPEIAARTVTLLAPSKTFNLAGMGLGFAVSNNIELIGKLQAFNWSMGAFPNALAYTSALAAYRDSQPWLDEAMTYLKANRDFIADYADQYLPQVTVNVPQGTYMTWIDCREAGEAAADPYTFFMEKAKVALTDGKTFGAEGVGFVRLNFACPRATLIEALDRMRAALEA